MNNLNDDVMSLVFSYLGLKAPDWRGVARQWQRLIDTLYLRRCLWYRTTTDPIAHVQKIRAFTWDELKPQWLYVHVCSRVPRMLLNDATHDIDPGTGRTVRDTICMGLTKFNTAVQCDADRWNRLENLSLDLSFTKTNPVLNAIVTPALRCVRLRYVTLPTNKGVGKDAGAALRARSISSPIHRFELQTEVSSSVGADDAGEMVTTALVSGIPTVTIRWRDYCYVGGNFSTGRLADAIIRMTDEMDRDHRYCNCLSVVIEGMYFPSVLARLFEAVAFRGRSLTFSWNMMHHQCNHTDWDLWHRWVRPATKLRVLDLNLAAMSLSAMTFRLIIQGALSGEWLPLLEEFRFDARFNVRIGNTAFIAPSWETHPPPPLRVLRIQLTAHDTLDTDTMAAWVTAVRSHIQVSKDRNSLRLSVYGCHLSVGDGIRWRPSIQNHPNNGWLVRRN